MIVGLGIVGVIVWLGYEAYQGAKATADWASAGFASLESAFAAFQQSVINGVTSPVTTFENWLSGGSSSPTSSAATTFQGLGNTYGGASSSSGSSDTSTGGGGASF